jgi:hypothetical protein
MKQACHKRGSQIRSKVRDKIPYVKPIGANVWLGPLAMFAADSVFGEAVYARRYPVSLVRR